MAGKLRNKMNSVLRVGHSCAPGKQCVTTLSTSSSFPRPPTLTGNDWGVWGLQPANLDALPMAGKFRNKMNRVFPGGRCYVIRVTQMSSDLPQRVPPRAAPGVLTISTSQPIT
jgi:hypothetical protein